MRVRARALSTVQDSTSQKFLLLGQLSRQDATDEGRVAAIFIDFAPLGRRKCGDDDFERWYARTAKNKECLMGHKVCLSSFCQVCILIDGYWDDSNGTGAERLARTATSVKSSQTPLSTRRIVRARTMTMNGTSY